MSECWWLMDWRLSLLSPLHNMLISIKNDTLFKKHMSCTFTASPDVQDVITSFILQPVAFKGAVSKNAVQFRIASKLNRLQYKSTAPLATVQQCLVKLHLDWYMKKMAVHSLPLEHVWRWGLLCIPPPPLFFFFDVFLNWQGWLQRNKSSALAMEITRTIDNI